MKHFLTGVFILLLFAAMLLFPKAVFEGASDGLLLWFQTVVPTLFPFMIVTEILMRCGGLHILCRVTGPMCHHLFGVSRYGSFAVLSGFLCGYPMGAKITADLIRDGKITVSEGRYLLSFCNNTSPVFIMNFVVWKTFQDSRLMAPTLLILLTVPVLCGFLFGIYYRRTLIIQDGNMSLRPQVRNNKNKEMHHPLAKIQSTESGSNAKGSFSFDLIDHSLENSMESIAKVGGYLILFSVLASLLSTVNNTYPARFLSALLEMTNGIVLLNQMDLPMAWKYSLTLGLTAFGGICSAAQTQSMIRQTGLSILPYIAQKLAAAVAASLLALYYITKVY